MTLLPRLSLGVLLLTSSVTRAADLPVDAPSADPLRVRVIAEVESRSHDEGVDRIRLIPADRVVPGDRVLYTLEVRNTAATQVRAPIVIHAVPEHTRYVDESATGPGADITFSVDGGHRFDVPRNLNVMLAGGQSRIAVAADYTHIRWQLKNPLEANSVAFVRFRAVVK
jgi:uncharacterized repeat protein (TIGR01451 family)